MGKITIKSFGRPDERRPFTGKGFMDVVKLGDGVVGRAVFEPGWRWSTHVKPIAGTQSCDTSHLGYVISGRMHVEMDDGEQAEIGPGDCVMISPGHDAWVTGNEPCVMVDFGSLEQYARPRGARPTYAEEPAAPGPQI
ncbi:MAG: cupin domain-containing protein [Deltaproteobacteria bacterium]|nr:cupin domain-containing protein [Deltaproteobacteria bacterium]